MCYAGLRSAGQFEHDQFTTCESSASIWEIERSSDDSLFSASASASVRAWLPTELDISLHTDLNTVLMTVSKDQVDDFLDQFKRRVDAMWFPELPGIEPWDIAENFSEYLALRKIEKWAAENLDE